MSHILQKGELLMTGAIVGFSGLIVAIMIGGIKDRMGIGFMVNSHRSIEFGK